MLQTRWAMSYLRGPLGRDEIHKLMEGKSRAETPPMTGQMTGQTDPISAPSVSAAPASSAAQMSTPMAPQGIPQFFAPASAGGTLAPSIYAALSLRLSNARLGVDSTQKIQVATPMTDGPVSVDWDNARLIQLTPAQLAPAAPAGVNFAPLPGSISKSDAGKWTTALKNWASASQGVELYQAGGLTSKPGESQRDFLARVDLATREQRDEQLDKLREKYQSKRATLEDKVERAKATIGRETSQAAGAGLDSVLSIGATIAGALLGHGYRRSAGSAMRSAGHAIQQGTDIKRAHDTYNQAVQELSDFDAQFQQEALKVKTPQLEDIKTVTLKPGKDDVQVDLLALVWMPQS